jgi:hypothetical protein
MLSAAASATAAIKDASLDYWDDVTGVSNSMKFTARGAGYRKYNGPFRRIKEVFIMLSSSRPDWSAQWAIVLQVEGDGFNQTFSSEMREIEGLSVRLFRPATTAEQLLPDGTACDNYIGNDLKEYPTVKIGTQVWLACNLAETKFRTGEDIPIVTDNAAWSALTTAGMCYYENNPVYSHTVVSTDKSLRFGLGIGKSPGNYSDAKVVVNGTEYIAHSITQKADGSGEILINDVDNPGLNLTLAVWSDEYYHIYYKDLSNVYSFSTINNAFAFEVDIIPTHLIKQNGELYSLFGRHDIWKENVGNYAQFYNIYRDGEIEYIINPKLSVVCLFNNFEYAMEAFNSSVKTSSTKRGIRLDSKTTTNTAQVKVTYVPLEQ